MLSSFKRASALQFSEILEVGLHSFVHDYAHTFVQHNIMFLEYNDMLNCHTSGLRFPMRRTNVAEKQLFNVLHGEGVSAAVADEGCCYV